MPDPSSQLQSLVDAGFQLETFERYPKAVGAVRDGGIALLEVHADGLRLVQSGWRMGEVMGLLVERNGLQVFQYKSETVEATPERLAALGSLRKDVETLLAAP
ncbi:MAG TPA: hypothetical protein VLT85_07300 [Terriglobales bacterium]|nr:hypothetical protein [Terriglobales bacterium]